MSKSTAHAYRCGLCNFKYVMKNTDELPEDMIAVTPWQGGFNKEYHVCGVCVRSILRKLGATKNVRL